VNSAAATLGEMLLSAPSSSSTEQIRLPLPLREDPWLDPTRVFAALSPPISSPRRTSSWCSLCITEVVMVCVHAGGSTECGAPGGATVKSSLGSLWPAAWALPRHAVQICAWANGERVPIFLFSSPLFSGHGYWPSGHDQWAELIDMLLWCCYLMQACYTGFS
jgi:hypothetical protein